VTPTDVASLAIRPATARDRTAVLHIARDLVRSGDTYAYDADIDDDALWAYWFPRPPAGGYVALHGDEVVGAFVIRPNQPGPGSHVANASYAVRADVRGAGIGRRLGEASLAIAAERGYRAMQFNIVVSTNHHAVRLWRSLGFEIVGTIPAGFRLPDGSYVDHYVMWRAVLPIA
jgi:ribosomal protein S18 acetylase RimI-like enzyme